MPTKLIAVIPAYGEEFTVGRVVTLTRAYVNDVVVVDDGSTDQTVAVAKSASARVISIPHGGKGTAVRVGMAEAVKLGGEVIVCLDADLQHNPEDIPTLVEPIENRGSDVVIGTRFRTQTLAPWPIVWVNRLHAWLVSRYLQRDFSDIACGFRAFSKHAANTLSWNARGFGFEVEQLFDAVKAGLIIAEVPISAYYDVHLQPKIDNRHVLRIVFDMHATLSKYFIRSFRGLLFQVVSIFLLIISLVILLSMVQLAKLRSRGSHNRR
jgi:glycosyltransferase involved in cell wall biosynthesis